MSRRAPLPHRRQNLTLETGHGPQRFTVTIGYDEDGRPMEVFADGHKEGSAMQAFVDDACIVISLALQHGIPKEALARTLGTVPAHHGGQEIERRASPIGVIVDAIALRPEVKKLTEAKRNGPA